MKPCTKCKAVKPFEEFYTNPNRSSGYNSWCKVCCVETNRWGHVKRKYGLTQEQYLQMLEEQNGVCAICLNPENKVHKGNQKSMLSVDHDHETGAVRGLLCDRCNTGLAAFRDQPQYMMNAILYLDAKEVLI